MLGQIEGAHDGGAVEPLLRLIHEEIEHRFGDGIVNRAVERTRGVEVIRAKALHVPSSQCGIRWASARMPR